jgi:hypothetical protein
MPILSAAGRAGSPGSCCAAIGAMPRRRTGLRRRWGTIRRGCRQRARRSPRGGGCTFAEDPGKRAPAARLFWTSAFDPAVLRARAFGRASGVRECAGLRNALVVAAGARKHLVVGGPLTGIRLDLTGDIPARWRALLFHVQIDASLPAQLAELARLRRAIADGAVPPPQRFDEGRAILALRTIDALAEGASLRAIGLGIVGAGEWPGEGEWMKSRARRLVAAARATWAGGPRAILSGACDSETGCED